MATSGEAGSAEKKAFTSEQVRAWLGTVLAPMAEALRVEDEQLRSGSPSFRAYSHSIDFELLWGSDRMVSNRYRPNLEQFFRHHPEIRAGVEKHDEALGRLRDACGKALDELLASREFQDLVVDRSRSEHRALAQEVVNGVKILESWHPLAGVWSERGDKLLSLRHAPGLSSQFKVIEEAIEELRRLVRELLARVSELQQKLADDYGLPPVADGA